MDLRPFEDRTPVAAPDPETATFDDYLAFFVSAGEPEPSARRLAQETVTDPHVETWSRIVTDD